MDSAKVHRFHSLNPAGSYIKGSNLTSKSQTRQTTTKKNLQLQASSSESASSSVETSSSLRSSSSLELSTQQQARSPSESKILADKVSSPSNLKIIVSPREIFLERRKVFQPFSKNMVPWLEKLTFTQTGP